MAAAAAICSRGVSAPRRLGGGMGRVALPLWALLGLWALRAPAPGVAAGGPAGERCSGGAGGRAAALGSGWMMLVSDG